MVVVDITKIKADMSSKGIKQIDIVRICGIGEVRLSLILHGKREMRIGEYADICKVLGVSIDEYLIDITKDC